MYSVNQWIDYNGPPGFEYFTNALELLPDMHEEGSILFVETLALVGYFMQNLNRIDAAFLYVGMALRMAITLGLHQESNYPGLDEAAKERRRRVWWSVYSLDRIQSVKSGNPITIHDEDIGVAFPSKLPHEPDYCAAMVLRHYTKLSQICGEITVSIYRRTPKSASTLMASVKKIIISLSRWHQDLPEQLRFDPARLSISRESVSTLLHYSQCINMTARPLLFHVVQKLLKAGRGEKERERDWKDGLTHTTVKVIEMCVAAARDTINMMTIAAQKNLVATYGYMDSEHAFSAATVLVMVCVAFPANQDNTNSMNAALELLRSMSQRGNNHMAARHDLLDRLRATFIPEAASASSTSAGPSPLSSTQTRPIANLPASQSATRCSKPPAPSSKESPSAAHLKNVQSSFFSSYFGPAAVPMTHGVLPNVQTASNILPPEPNFPQLPDFPFLTNPRFGEGLFNMNDLDVGSGTGNNQDFWEEAFANPAGDPGNTLMESLEWTQIGSLNPFGENGGHVREGFD